MNRLALPFLIAAAAVWAGAVILLDLLLEIEERSDPPRAPPAGRLDSSPGLVLDPTQANELTDPPGPWP